MNVEIDEFVQMNLSERQILLDELNNILEKDFTKRNIESDDSIFLTFLHNETGIEFNYIPAGTFDMGFSDIEELNARKICNSMPLNLEEMRPVKKPK